MSLAMFRHSGQSACCAGVFLTGSDGQVWRTPYALQTSSQSPGLVRAPRYARVGSTAWLNMDSTTHMVIHAANLPVALDGGEWRMGRHSTKGWRRKGSLCRYPMRYCPRLYLKWQCYRGGRRYQLIFTSVFISCRIVVEISSMDFAVEDSQRMPSRFIMASASLTS